jgi:hypothetical protein
MERLAFSSASRLQKTAPEKVSISRGFLQPLLTRLLQVRVLHGELKISRELTPE